MPGRIVLYGRQTSIRRDAWQKPKRPEQDDRRAIAIRIREQIRHKYPAALSTRRYRCEDPDAS